VSTRARCCGALPLRCLINSATLPCRLRDTCCRNLQSVAGHFLLLHADLTADKVHPACGMRTYCICMLHLQPTQSVCKAFFSLDVGALLGPPSLSNCSCSHYGMGGTPRSGSTAAVEDALCCLAVPVMLQFMTHLIADCRGWGTQIAAMPPLRPLVLVLKALLRGAELNEVYHGGLSSYTTSVMVMAHLQHEGYRSPDKISVTTCWLPDLAPQDLGHLLMSFLARFVRHFNYESEAVSIQRVSTAWLSSLGLEQPHSYHLLLLTRAMAPHPAYRHCLNFPRTRF
jgi:hypothetical protein